MATKTESIVREMNYFLSYKESGGQSCDISSSIYKNIADIFGNQVKNGLKTEEEIESFYNTLPGTENLFENPMLHPDLSVIPPYFEQVVEVSQAEMSVEQGEKAKVA